MFGYIFFLGRYWLGSLLSLSQFFLNVNLDLNLDVGNSTVIVDVVVQGWCLDDVVFAVIALVEIRSTVILCGDVRPTAASTFACRWRLSLERELGFAALYRAWTKGKSGEAVVE